MAKTKGQGLKLFVIAAIGAAIGGIGTAAFISSEHYRSEAAERRAEEIAYVAVQRMTLPVVDRNGELEGYMTVDFALEVPAERRAYVRQRVPEVRHAVNVAAWKTRLIATDSGGLDIDETRAMLLSASRGALGKGNVREVRVLTAVPV